MEQLNHLEVVEIEAEGMYVLRIADVIWHDETNLFCFRLDNDGEMIHYDVLCLVYSLVS
jgi:hypothetical protein